MDGVYCLDIRGEQSPFADPNLPHPCLSMPGGAIGDFLPHLAYLVYLFGGPHRSLRTIWSKRDPKTPLPSDEFRAIIDGAGATASIGFTSSAGPDGFWFTLYCTKALVRMNLFENRLTINRKLGGPPPLVLYRETRREGREVRRSAWAGLKRKLSPGPGLYEGLYRLIERMYTALRNGESPPIPPAQIEQVRRLVVDLTDPENRI
jgi:predicted dehydrogenase